MFSKRLSSRILSVILALSLGLVASSCSRFLDEKRETPQTLEMSNAKFACLQSLPVEITKFVKGTVVNEDIHHGFDCAKDALIYFRNKTKGTYDDAYTMEDLRNFFGKYFLKKNNVTPEFGTELFKLKQVFLGGSEKFITKAEIQRLVELLDVVRDQAILVAPYMPILLLESKDPSWIQVDNATHQLGEAIWSLFKQVDLANSNYTFDDLKKFMDGLDKFINAAETFSLTKKVGNNMPLVEAAKNILIGENNTMNDMRDWRIGVDTVMGVYRESLRYLYFIKDRDVSSPAQVKALLLVTDDALGLLEQSLPVQRQGAISFANIDTLIDILESRRMLPFDLSSRAVKETYKKIVLRILDPKRRGDSRGLLGLERNHIVALKHELKIFQLHQRFIDGLKLDQNGTVSFAEIQQALTEFKAADIIAQDLSQETLEQEALNTAWDEGAALLVRDFPVFYNYLGRQIVTGNAKNYRQTWNSLTRWNVMRALSRAMLLGYGNTHNPNLSQETMVEAGFEQWYTDFNQLGVELKAFDPRSQHSGARSFKEANFFTSGGNGDALMDSRETFDFVSLLVSGGMSSAEFVRKDIAGKGCALADKDIFGFAWMNEDCFQKTLRQNFGDYFNNLPGMVIAVANMKDAEWNVFYGNLMSAARTSPANGGRIETADLRTAVMILHYTESLMTVYDRDFNSKLSITELRAAAPRFLEFMKTVSPVKANFLVTDFFLFLVYKGKKPTIWEYTVFQGQKAFDSLDEVGRDKILQVFKVLKDEAAKK